MNLDIRALSPDQADAYLYFFDEVAFADHPDWSWCYCLESYTTDADEKELNAKGKEGRRAKAAEWIQDGTMKGYLAYEEGEVVGWCNAADKAAYPRVRADRARWTDADAPGRAMAIVCFAIAPAKRGQGIATALLRKICADAREKGYAYIEAYPMIGEQDCFLHYHGPVQMYEREGFEKVSEREWYSIVRKTL